MSLKRGVIALRVPPLIPNHEILFKSNQQRSLQTIASIRSTYRYQKDRPKDKEHAPNHHIIMRPLTEEETKTLFLKLSEYMGRSIERMINRTDERHCFRLLKDRVYYVSESSLKAAAPISKDHLLHFGTCIGKFTKSGKFRLHITALDYLAQYAKYKVWLKPNAEMSFLYGNNVLKSGMARITESTPQYAGVVVYNMSDIPLGFGVAAQTTDACRELEPTGNVVLHQADIGEYLRGVEDDMF